MSLQSFMTTIVNIYGDRGATWLADLPTLIRNLEEQWSIHVGDPMENLSYNYVAAATLADGAPAVLKLGPPRKEFTNEIRALEAYGGGSMVRLLQADEDTGSILLERLSPGDELVTLSDDEAAVRIAASLMRKLRVAPPTNHAFPTVDEWALSFDRYECEHGDRGPIPLEDTRRAKAVFRELNASSAEPILLHGDLHHYNILRAGVAWKAIDPQGVIGEPAYEVGAFLRNPWPQLFEWKDAAERTNRRIDVFSEELGFERERIRLWGYAQAILSACWTMEDREADCSHSLGFAALMRP